LREDSRQWLDTAGNLYDMPAGEEYAAPIRC
jgi:hypothetical protein